MTPGAPRPELVTRKLCLLGFGNVGRRFCELLVDKEDDLAARYGLRVLITAVGTSGHGSLLAPEGLGAGEVLRRAGYAGPPDASPAHAAGLRLPDHVRSGPDLIAASHADLLVEATAQESRGAAAAIAHVEAALAHVMDVVTVNKGPVAWDYRRLADLAAERGLSFRCEGVVMDGFPVFNLVEFALRGSAVLGFDGVLNSTTNSILDAMGEGRSFAAALAHAQDLGITEADPTLDIDGIDAASKVAALANVLMDARITPDDVPRESIREVAPARLNAAREAGNRLRVLCSGRPDDYAVRVTELGPSHPLLTVTGSSSGLVLHTDLMGDVELIERDGLAAQTAYAVYSDLLTIHAKR